MALTAPVSTLVIGRKQKRSIIWSWVLHSIGGPSVVDRAVGTAILVTQEMQEIAKIWQTQQRERQNTARIDMDQSLGKLPKAQQWLILPVFPESHPQGWEYKHNLWIWKGHMFMSQ